MMVWRPRVLGFYRRFRLTIRHEPAWHMEAVSGFGIALWGVLTLAMEHYPADSLLWLVPVGAVLFGFWRGYELKQHHSLGRIICGMACFVWWGWLTYVQIRGNGYMPMIAASTALVIGDFLTVLKFSLPGADAWSAAPDHAGL